ncbi:ferric reductase like transmembrane component-domain-containing protein [Xylariales sp. AK1849]|nr:ferric reductase like transmembrane component-domain-containing protein [Xylariales sp. AK1849]
MGNSITDWAPAVFKASLRSGDRRLFLDDAAASSDDPGRRIPNDPEKLEYLKRLIAYVLDGREIAAKYNYVLLLTLLVLAVIHWSRKLRNAWPHQAVGRPRQEHKVAGPLEIALAEDSGQTLSGEASVDEATSSSSSSTIQGTQSPSGPTKAESLDLERQPLLGKKASSNPPTGTWVSFRDSLVSWMMYQPRPIPIIKRTLPSNGTSLFILGYFGVNIFFQFFRTSLRPEYFFAFADRAGYTFIVNLPLLYLLAAKNQPLKFLTGYSYEALNIFHRRVGELMCFAAFLHFAGMLTWELVFTPDWLKVGDLQHFLTTRLCLLGIGAFASYELLFFTSLGSFRERFYEVFLASHVVLQIAALVFLYLHFWTSRPYVIAAMVIFITDRLFWRLCLKSSWVQANVHILEDGDTLMLSADWDIIRPRGSRFARWFGQNIIYGWKPMDHVFVTVPSLGRLHALQAHPFTIASAAPVSMLQSDGHPTHAWLNLLIRARGGFSADLLRYACSHPTVSVRLDGPYGSTDALEMLGGCDTIVLIAGGSGIAVIFPLLWSLVYDRELVRADGSRGRDVHILWVIHSRSHRSWIPQQRLAELADAGVHVTVSEPTAEVGRPDVGSYINDLGVDCRSSGRGMGVIVSGPDNLNRTARNACAQATRQGADVRLSVEKFGW